MSAADAPAMRGPFQGTLQILQYNWPFYAGGSAVVVLAAIFLALVPLPAPLPLLGWVGVTVALFWTLGSLAVSWYVYDYSPLYRWAWIPDLFSKPPRRWANLHTGLDESTPTLRAFFPDTKGHIFDFYDPATMTEPSIRRARALTPPPEPPTPACTNAIPLPDAELDAAFLLFAAHEIRDAGERKQFFAELQRTLRPGGRIVLAEHLRDTANFIAFGPGFLHFWPASEWRRLAGTAELTIVQEFSVTPFVCIFVLERPLTE
jgi:SAM-dependent methyltransferase